MKIEYYGHSFVKLTFSNFSIAIDPYGDIGLNPPNVFADYVFCSHDHYDHNNATIVCGAKRLDVDAAAASGGRFTVLNSFHDENHGAFRGKNDVLVINADDKKIVHFGDIGCYDEKVVKKTSGADIIFIPIGGKYTIDAIEAMKYIDAIKPKTIIPIHYKIDGSTVDIAKIEDFLKMINEYKTKNSGFILEAEDTGVIIVTTEVKNV